MARKKNRRSRSTKVLQKTATSTSVSTHRPEVGMLVTDEFEKALDHCRTMVYQYANDCRAKNRKFRDIEFDLDNDSDLCYYGLTRDSKNPLQPLTGVSRVTDIYPKPEFFIDGPDSSDIVQGDLGDCWFLSALSVIAAPKFSTTNKSLIEKTCVARDEKVGVYGFAFFKNGVWETVIIDDLLFVKVPKFEELSLNEQDLFHKDKQRYNKSARKGGKNLCFARSGTENETWVPLVEKAYAKLHGDYSALVDGRAAEALEDLTGGVSSMILTKDILNIDKFWEEELLRTNDDRLFSAGYRRYGNARNFMSEIKVEGLLPAHAYSVLKATEVSGKRFLILRNPWGHSEWKGPWSDGAKEWTPEWLARLSEIGHVFGDDGQFLMEYADFLQYFEEIDKIILFDDTWRMSMQWLAVKAKPPPYAQSFGNITFDFTITVATKAVIVLSKLDDRYFKGEEGDHNWNLQFRLYNLDSVNPCLIAQSEQGIWCARSVNSETYLKPGNYTVQVRIEGIKRSEPPNLSTCDQRKLGRVWTELVKARSAALNFDTKPYESKYFDASMDSLLEQAQDAAADRRYNATFAFDSPETAFADVQQDVAQDEDGSLGDPCANIEPDEGDSSDKQGEDREEKIGAKFREKEGEGITETRGGENNERAALSESLNGYRASQGITSGYRGTNDDNLSPVSVPCHIASNAIPAGHNRPKLPVGSEVGDVFLGLRIYTQGGMKVSILGTVGRGKDAKTWMTGEYPRNSK